MHLLQPRCMLIKDDTCWECFLMNSHHKEKNSNERFTVRKKFIKQTKNDMKFTKIHKTILKKSLHDHGSVLFQNKKKDLEFFILTSPLRFSN